MRHSTAAALVIGLFFPAPELSVITQPRRVYAIVDVTVIPMDRERLLNHQVVIVRGDRIAEVGSMGSVRVPPAAVRIDGRNRYLLPGMFDMHAHVEDTTDMLLWLAKGFTTVRNLEGRPQHLQWRRSIRTGQLLGPDIFTSGPFTNLPGISTPEDARRAVIAQKAAGYDEIKIHGSLNADAYDTLCAVARRVEIPIVGHAVRNLPFDAMVRCGQADISHAEEFIYGYFAYDVSDSAARLIPRAADSTRRAGMHVTPTLVTYRRILAQVENLDSLMAVTPTHYVSPAELIMWQRENNRYIRNWPASTIPKLRARWRFQVELVRALFHAGVPLMSGSDAIGPTWVPGWASQEELRIFVQDIGMSPYEALRTATVIPAAFLGESNEVGTVAPGRRADLVLLEGNPLKDITQIDRIAGVLVRGRWLPRREIAFRLEAIARANKRIANQARKIIRLGWRRAATARCDSTSLMQSPTVGPIVELSIQSEVANLIRRGALAKVIAEATEIRRLCPEARVFSESKINAVANELSTSGQVPQAIEVLRTNAQLFPRSFLAPYWLAEAQLAAGDTAAAIANYRKSVANDPAMLDAIERLKNLRAWGR